MAKKSTISNKFATPVNVEPIKGPPVKTSTNGDISSPVRNTAIPKYSPMQIKKEITSEQIAKRAYEISKSGAGGSDLENWLRAERELRATAR